MINRIATLLDVKVDEIEYREWVDSFNHQHQLQGYICRRSDYRYGCLVITCVNGWPCCQTIYATPKLDYPFDRAGTYHWPDVKKMEFYEKLDGTNICAYHYQYDGQDFTSYKTRLTPVVKDQKFGMFETMWRSYVEESKWVEEVIAANPSYNLSFELHGSRNPITIIYPFPLDVALLFGIERQTACVVPPSLLRGATKMPTAYQATGAADLTKQYNDFREEMSMKNKDALSIEGMVMYALVRGETSYRMFKVKPEEVEKLHWTASGHIPERSLYNTALNCFESHDNPTINDLITLLQEEYSSDLITRSYLKIENIFEKATENMKFVNLVNEIWTEGQRCGIKFNLKNKNEIMRFLSSHFPKSSMRRVGSIIIKKLSSL